MIARWVVCAVVVVLAAILAAAPDAASAVTVRVLQLNICHSGIAGCFTGDRVLAKAAAVIDSTQPQVVSVNEACAGDVEPLRSAMGTAHALFVAAQHRDGTPVRCRNGQEFGNVIMVASQLAGTAEITGRYAVQQGNNELRVWACLPAGRLTACTTHLADRNATVALAQCRELMAHAAGYARTGPVVIAGDMNLPYLGTTSVQLCNHPGFYRKGDGNVQHVFATENLSFLNDSRIDMAGTTDHPAWLVTLTL